MGKQWENNVLTLYHNLKHQRKQLYLNEKP